MMALYFWFPFVPPFPQCFEVVFLRPLPSLFCGCSWLCSSPCFCCLAAGSFFLPFLHHHLNLLYLSLRHALYPSFLIACLDLDLVPLLLSLLSRFLLLLFVSCLCLPSLCQVGVAVSADSVFQQVSYVNAICTIKGGTHVECVANQVITKLLPVLKRKHKAEVRLLGVGLETLGISSVCFSASVLTCIFVEDAQLEMLRPLCTTSLSFCLVR